jgi:ribonuclease P protein component
MLPRQHRLTRPDDFRRTIRAGNKVVTPTVIVYGLRGGASGESAEVSPRVGVTVNKAVGGSVVRHRVARQVRHTMAAVMGECPPASSWVIRALPAAAGADSLRSDIQKAVRSIVQRWTVAR